MKLVFRSLVNVVHSAQTHPSVPAGHQYASKKPSLVMPLSSLKALGQKSLNKIALFGKKMDLKNQ